jgi:hypothetical protein
MKREAPARPSVDAEATGKFDGKRGRLASIRGLGSSATL